MKNKSCCFTGHRKIPKADIQRVLERTETYIRAMIAEGVTQFYVGGAVGYDTLVAKLLFSLRQDEKLKQIKVVLIYPFDGFTDKWNPEERTEYATLLPAYDEVIRASEKADRASYLLRDRMLVDQSAYCVSYCTRKTGGTAYTVRYAIRNGVKVMNTADYDVRQV